MKYSLVSTGLENKVILVVKKKNWAGKINANLVNVLNIWFANIIILNVKFLNCLFLNNMFKDTYITEKERRGGKAHHYVQYLCRNTFFLIPRAVKFLNKVKQDLKTRNQVCDFCFVFLTAERAENTIKLHCYFQILRLKWVRISFGSSASHISQLTLVLLLCKEHNRPIKSLKVSKN